MTVRELGERMQCDEFLEWWTLYVNEPWGDERLDTHVSTLLAAQIGERARGYPDWRWRRKAATNVDEARRLLAKFEAFEVDHGKRRRNR